MATSSKSAASKSATRVSGSPHDVCILDAGLNGKERHGLTTFSGRRCTLDSVEPGECCTVTRVQCADRELLSRLLSMGIVEDSSVSVVQRAPLGDPIQVKTLGYHLSLRRSEARNVEVITGGGNGVSQSDAAVRALDESSAKLPV